MKKVILIAGFCLLLILIAGGILVGKQRQVTITQDQIDSKLAEVFPARKTYFLIFHITCSNPEVTLVEESGRIQVNMETDLELPGDIKALDGMIVASSGVRYDRELKSVFLTEPVIESIQIERIPDKYLEKVTAVVTKAASDFLSEQPIYHLKATGMKKTAANLLMKKVEVKAETIVLHFGL